VIENAICSLGALSLLLVVDLLRTSVAYSATLLLFLSLSQLKFSMSKLIGSRESIFLLCPTCRIGSYAMHVIQEDWVNDANGWGIGRSWKNSNIK
jgi:hypothetical protein